METEHKPTRNRLTNVLWTCVELLGVVIASVASVMLIIGAVFALVWAVLGVHGVFSDAFGDKPSETYQCLIDTYLTDHHYSSGADPSDNYSVSNDDEGLWLNIDNQPILQIDETQFAEGISRC